MLLTFTVSPLSPHATSLSVHEFERLLTRQLPLSPLTGQCVRDKHKREGGGAACTINVRHKSYKVFMAAESEGYIDLTS